MSIPRKDGTERFHSTGRDLGFDLLDFWQWGASDLLGNILRGRLAEYLVARALDVATGCRVEWDACDLIAHGRKIEVKSAAFVQSWPQRRPSTIRFTIRPTLGWDAATNTQGTERKRHADLYVFALLHHRDLATMDPLDESQWSFFVLPASRFDERCPTQKTISLAALSKLEPVSTTFAGLRVALLETASR